MEVYSLQLLKSDEKVICEINIMIDDLNLVLSLLNAVKDWQKDNYKSNDDITIKTIKV